MLKINLEDLRRIPINKTSFRKVSQVAGVYLFLENKKPIYIGKSVNLKSRLLSYLGKDLGPKTQSMVRTAKAVSYIKVPRELDAFLLEAELIHQLQPKYNVIFKDDKHPLYIKITDEEYPRVIPVRKNNLDGSITYFGPFPSSKNVREVLRILRKIIPYSDHKIGKRKCIYAHLGLCDPCPNETEDLKDLQLQQIKKALYKSNIKRLINILKRNSDKVLDELHKQMTAFSKKENYEEATKIRTKIRTLEYILQPATATKSFLENPNLAEDILNEEIVDLIQIISPYLKVKAKIKRIECFDVAHLGGSFPTASMVTFVEGTSDKNYYRHFKIRQEKGQDDIASLHEVAKRRIKNLVGWGRPDLIIVDGGRGQVSVFVREFQKFNIPVIGLAKRYESLIIPRFDAALITYVEIRLGSGPAYNLVTRIRNEAHRFARRYHHLLLSRGFIS